MKKLFRETYGVGILIFYFFKWPYVLGFPYVYFEKGLQENLFLNFLWFYCVGLIIKDLFYLVKYGPRCTPEKKCNTTEEKKTD